MTEVTAEMIERGRGGHPNATADRRRVTLQIRAAREKLTSSGSGHRTFDVELLKLYAERRAAALPGLMLLSVAFAIVASQWTTLPILVTWLGLNAVAIFATAGLAEGFLARAAKPTTNIARWSRVMIAAETTQGCIWAVVVVLATANKDPQAAIFFLVALLLVAAMNATVTATIPVAVYGALTPMTIAIVVLLHPTSISGSSALVAALAVGTQVYFVMLARKLYTSALQALNFQAEKDVLIAELEQSKANSDLARRRAEESNLAKSRFLATMSHELRTPLNAILGFSEVMKAELFGAHTVPSYKDYSSDIHSSGEHLLMLINEILDLSRVEAGRYDLHEESVDLRGIVDECRHLVALRARKKDILILEDHANDLDDLPRLWADARAVRQIALNLLSNAIKFTPPGGQVRLRLGRTPDGGQSFSIEDTGTGIPENEIPVVMSSFGRGTLAQKNADEGTGLGLPIVKGLVDLHGGTFSLASKIREGTTVTVSFPPERVMSVLPHHDVETPRARVTPLKPVRNAA